MSLVIQEIVDPSDLTLPILLYQSFKIADANGSFAIHLGLTLEEVQQLKKYSLDVSDTAIQNNTSDRKRFGLGSYEEWYAGGRVPFALVHTSGDLAALAWFGPKEIPIEAPAGLPWHTVAYRAYMPYRGKGIMTDFSRFVLQYYQKLYPGIRLWAEVKEGNEASLVLAKKLGFVEQVCLTERECGIILTKES